MHRLVCTIAVFLSIHLSSNTFAQSLLLDKPLTIETAIEKTIKNNVELKYYLKNIEVKNAEKYQSELFPNPELDVEAENIMGNKDFSGFQGSEITASLSQNILLAGKISKREKVANLEIKLAEWDYESKKIEIITEVRNTFQKALAVQLLKEKNKELIKVSEEFISNLQRRVNAGKISPAEISRARIILNSLVIDLNRLESEYETYKSELISFMYQPDLTIDSLVGELEYEVDIPSYDILLKELENNPKLKRYQSEYDKQKAVVSLEESRAVPDLTISAGYKRLNDANANTFLIGASMPLPIFNRNQGSIQAAEISFDQKKIEYESIKNVLTLKLKVLHKRLTTLAKSAKQLDNESIPQAEEAFNIIKEGNLVGRFAIIDVIDAERTLFELQNQYLNVIGEIHSVKIEIEGLIAKEII